MSWLTKLVERRILKARAEGKLQNLPGEGEPLPERRGDVHVDAGLAAGYRVMAEAGVLPEEIRLQKEIDAHKATMANVSSPEKRKAAMKVLADLELRRNIAVEARKRFHAG